MKATSYFISLILSGAACLAAPAHAGDIAAFQTIGFSKDGSIYAFEEYGVQDGSGFAYSNIYVIDTVKDTYLPGTPVRILIKDEAVGVGTARAQALEKAAPLIEQHRLADNPGLLAAFNPVSDASGNPYQISYYAYAAAPPFGSPYRLALEEVIQPAAEKCRSWTERSSSFKLKMLLQDGKNSDRIVYDEQRAPESRGCVTGYRLGGVVTHQAFGTNLHMALVTVLQHGFEGQNGRWIAVPVRP
jgi:predicted secreted protein